MNDSTIAAISTAIGEAGIGIIRMSGDKALLIAKKLTNKSELKNRFMHYSKIYDKGKMVDEALVCYMKAPNSYTGEDLVEIQCHGSSASLRKILSLCLEEGCEMAERGEFTKRAFLNGRLDLSEAEAVIDLIKAKTEKSLSLAGRQLEGNLNKRISMIRGELKELLINITVNMDYPDEDIEEITYLNIENSLSAINDKILKLLAQSDEGKIIREGLLVAIIGKPNVGKSSLMNIFMGENRSIVSSIAGTTRDTIEESAQIKGIPVRLIDTAGIHESEDFVEKLGIEKSKEVFDKADLVLLILDASKELEEEDILLINALDDNAIIILNKTDLEKKISFDKYDLNKKYNKKIINTSFTNGNGIDELKDEIEKFIIGSNIENHEDPILSNIRHINLVKKALSEINEALYMTKIKEPIDLIEINAKEAFNLLGEITGETASGEIIDEIFSRFCLGK